MYKLGFLLLSAALFTSTLVGEVGALNSQHGLLAKARWATVDKQNTPDKFKVSQSVLHKQESFSDLVFNVYKYWYAN